MDIDDTTNIPKDEQEKFAKHLYRYHLGSVIIQEGESDNAIYLLREGTVAVERLIGEKSTQISTIEAVNFFGEMAMILGAKRSATIRVMSPQAIVYKFQTFDLRNIYTNPAWAELLITRLCNDLIETNTRAVSVENDNRKWVTKNNHLIRQTSILFSALLALEGNIAADAMVNSKDWKLVQGMRELTTNFLKSNLPEILAGIGEDKLDALNKLRLEEGFPEILKSIL